jgi:hypothetical protein
MKAPHTDCLRIRSCAPKIVTTFFSLAGAFFRFIPSIECKKKISGKEDNEAPPHKPQEPGAEASKCSVQAVRFGRPRETDLRRPEALCDQLSK